MPLGDFTPDEHLEQSDPWDHPDFDACEPMPADYDDSSAGLAAPSGTGYTIRCVSYRGEGGGT